MYGLNKNDLKQIQKKHNIQREYLEESFFVTKNGQSKSLLDVSFSANHSERYYSELLNKINTIDTLILASSVDYDSIFITITLDGFFRDFLKANFKRYNESKHSHLIPNNDAYGYLRDKIRDNVAFNIKDLYNCLNFQLKRFQSSASYRRIKKSGHKPHYIRVCEPHKKDGVPHLHMMLYIPLDFRESILEAYKKYFPAPQNLKPLNNDNDGQIMGFQWKIKSAPAYILKYLFKTFLDVKNCNDIDYIQAWYIKHRILRVVTSHSLIPAWIYRKAMLLDNDWFYLSDIRESGLAEWSKENDFFHLIDEHCRELIYDSGQYTLLSAGHIIKQFGKKIENIESYKIDITIKKFNKKDTKDDDNNIFAGLYKYIPEKSNTFNGVPIVPSKLKDFQLKRYFDKLLEADIDSISLTHFLLTKNEMISRKLLAEDLQPLNNMEVGF